VVALLGLPSEDLIPPCEGPLETPEEGDISWARDVQLPRLDGVHESPEGFGGFLDGCTRGRTASACHDPHP